MKTYITVLDFTLGKVFQYKAPNKDWQCEDYEKYLSELGHNLNNCEFMVHNYNKIITE